MEIGNVIFYPMHGAGEIIKKEEKLFDGEKTVYCTVRINVKNLMLQFPEDRVDLLNIREISSLESIEKAIYESSNKNFSNDGNWNKRYQSQVDKLKTGTINDMCDVIVNFYSQEVEKSLSSGERQLYHTSFNVLTSELMYVLDSTKKEAEEFLTKKLKEVL